MYLIIFAWGLMIRVLDWFNGKRFYPYEEPLERLDFTFCLPEYAKLETGFENQIRNALDIPHWYGVKIIKNPHFFFEKMYLNIRWAENKQYRSRSWTIIGIHQNWVHPYQFSVLICFFGFELNILFQAREKN